MMVECMAMRRCEQKMLAGRRWRSNGVDFMVETVECLWSERLTKLLSV